jgi:ElaB/YqjD/DUF883 family membrane-anchored ribosome-binding protein
MSADPVHPYDETRLPAHPEPVVPRTPAARRSNLVVVAGSEAHSSAAMNEAAENIGAAVGKAVDTVQHLRDQLQEMKQRFTVIKGRAQQDVTSKAGELKKEAAEKVSEARTRAEQLAHRAEHLAHENPFQVILAMAGIGLVLGIVLRIWRDHAD